jgi:DNA helicase-2/ATP-dependent DNA helicase PcrA
LAKALDDPHEMEEERRLFYVAVTRARNHLTLSSAQERFRYGSFESAQSRFISEAPPETLEKVDLRSYQRSASGVQSAGSGRSLWSDSPGAVSASSSSSASADGSLTYEYEEEEIMRPGRIVRHRVFGRGKVLSVAGRGENMKIEVHFTGVGKKTLLAKFAKLEVVG